MSISPRPRLRCALTIFLLAAAMAAPLQAATDPTYVALRGAKPGGRKIPVQNLVLERDAFRFQLDNHLGSSIVELDRAANLISYEEYHPYGTTSYHATANALDVSPKRYRYTGKEREEETGLNYHGARYYAPWLARWTACAPTRATSSATSASEVVAMNTSAGGSA